MSMVQATGQGCLHSHEGCHDDLDVRVSDELWSGITPPGHAHFCRSLNRDAGLPMKRTSDSSIMSSRNSGPATLGLTEGRARAGFGGERTSQDRIQDRNQQSLEGNTCSARSRAANLGPKT